jgi:hypothetical protein
VSWHTHGNLQTRQLLTNSRWECVNVGFSFISFIIDLLQIAKFIAEALTPFGMLFGNVVSLVFSSAILALDVLVYVEHADKNYSILALALDCGLL